MKRQFSQPELDALKAELERRTTRDGDCLIWTGQLQQAGYGRIEISLGGRRLRVLAHRFVAEYVCGYDVTNLDACHHCDNRRCVEPTHLFAGSRKQNMQDAKGKGRTARGGRLPHTKLTEGAVHAIREDSRDYGAIAASFGTTTSSVSNIKNLIEWDWVPVRGVVHKANPGDRIAGEAHHCAKLTEEKVVRIRTGNEPLGALAEEFGVAYNTVLAALKGITWRRVTACANDNRLSACDGLAA